MGWETGEKKEGGGRVLAHPKNLGSPAFQESDTLFRNSQNKNVEGEEMVELLTWINPNLI